MIFQKNFLTLQYDKSPVTVEQTTLQTFKKLLDEKEMTNDEKQRMKVAFAEGYLIGNGRKEPGRTFRWLKIVQQMAMTGIFFAVLFSIMGVYEC